VYVQCSAQLYGVHAVRVRAYLRGDVASTRVLPRTVNCPRSSISCEEGRGEVEEGTGGEEDEDGDGDQHEKVEEGNE
jgi:hypothetical protein